jgi:hypothetical protein
MVTLFVRKGSRGRSRRWACARCATASPFNIKAESLTLANFIEADVQELYAQHTAGDLLDR